MGIDEWAERILATGGITSGTRIGVRPAASCSDGSIGAVLFVIQRSDGFLAGESVVALCEGHEWSAVGSVGGGWVVETQRQPAVITPIIRGAVGRYAVAAGVSQSQITTAHLHRGDEPVPLTIQSLLANHWIACVDTDASASGQLSRVHMVLLSGTTGTVDL